MTSIFEVLRVGFGDKGLVVDDRLMEMSVRVSANRKTLYYEVILESIDVEDEEMTENPMVEYKKPSKIKDHVGVLDMALYLLGNSREREKISGLTTDGDNKDCEAIFHHKEYGNVVLKVR
jgi:hypothetical protein